MREFKVGDIVCDNKRKSGQRGKVIDVDDTIFAVSVKFRDGGILSYTIGGSYYEDEDPTLFHVCEEGSFEEFFKL